MFRYTLVVLVLVVLVLQVAVQAALPINLITSDGLTSKASSQFEKYMENSFQEDNKVLNRVVGLLDCSSLDNDCKLVNELFGAHFASSASGK